MKSNVIRHDRFWAWISQDDRLQQSGEYTYGRDIDIRQWQFLELAKKPDNLYWASENWSIICGLYDTTSAKFWYGCSDGKLRYSTDNTSFTVAYTTSPARNILNIRIMNSTLYFWTNKYMYYNTTYDDGSSWTEVTTWMNDSNYRQVIHYSKDLLYFINGNVISYVDDATPWTVTDYGSFSSGGGAFAGRDPLVWITEHANSFWAYDSAGRMYVIDQWIQAVTSVKNFKEPIIGVYNNSDFDLVITASGTYYKAAYLNGGVWPNSHTLLRRYIDSEYTKLSIDGSLSTDGIRFNFTVGSCSDNSFVENSTVVYFKAREWDEDVIYSYGRINNALPQSLSILSSKREDGSSWGTISAMITSSWFLYVCWNDWVTRYVERIFLEDTANTINYQSSWFIVTRVDAGGIYEKPKQAGKLTIGADIPDWTSIKIYYSMDGSTFTLLGTEIWFDEIQGGTWTATLIQRTIPSQSFNEIAIKIELLTTDSTISPRLFSLEYTPSIVKLN